MLHFVPSLLLLFFVPSLLFDDNTVVTFMYLDDIYMTFYCYAENLRSYAVHAWIICYPNLRKPPRVVTVWVP